MTTEQIRSKVLQSQDLLDRIDEYKGFINELNTGIMAKLGSQEMNRQSIRQYNECIVNLEAELKDIWKI